MKDGYSYLFFLIIFSFICFFSPLTFEIKQTQSLCGSDTGRRFVSLFTRDVICALPRCVVAGCGIRHNTGAGHGTHLIYD